MFDFFGNESREFGWDGEEEAMMFQLFILLYADDTVICAESVNELQKSNRCYV